MSVTTTAPTQAPGRGAIAPPQNRWPLGPPTVLLGVVLVAMLMSTRQRPGRSRALALAPLAAIVLCVVFLPGCGGSGGSAPPPPPTGTQPGTYTLTVTATSGNLTHSTKATLVVE